MQVCEFRTESKGRGSLPLTLCVHEDRALLSQRVVRGEQLPLQSDEAEEQKFADKLGH